MTNDGSDSPPASLERQYFADMHSLKRRLASRTGSREAAEDLLHDLWLHLNGRSGDAVAAPAAHLRRVADNLAVDQARWQARRLPAAEIDALLEVTDNRPSVEDMLVARDDARVLAAALNELPERRGAIFVAARFGSERYAVIAERFGTSTRTVENEVRRTLDHVVRRLNR